MTYVAPPKHVTDRYRKVAVELSKTRPAMLLLARILRQKMIERRASNSMAFGESDALELVFAIQMELMRGLD